MGKMSSLNQVELRRCSFWVKVFSVSVIVFGLVCSLGGSHNALAADKFIAVYLHPDTLEWSSSQGGTLEAAKANARESCGKGCKFAGWSRNACLALAVTKSGGNCYGCSWGDTISEAIAKAKQYCRDRGCTCKTIFSECYQ